MTADAVDTSADMLGLLQRRCYIAASSSHWRLRTHNADALSYLKRSSGESFDLVVTHFFLDCLTQTEVDALADAVGPRLTPDAVWLVSDFRIPQGRMRLPARALVSVLYLAFRVVAGLRVRHLPDHAATLTRSGFSRVDHRYSLFGILATELWVRSLETMDGSLEAMDD